MYPIHQHSHYSALDGFGTVSEIAARLKDLGLPGGALTDHGVVAGLLEFDKVFRAEGLKPILGIEAYQARWSRKLQEHPETKKKFKSGQDSFHLVLLAKTTEGYRNLLRLNEAAQTTGFYYHPRVDWELLEKYSEGIICTSACMGGLVVEELKNESMDALHKFRNIFRDDFFVEIHTYDSDDQRLVNKALVDVCKQLGIRPLVANDAHYTKPEDFEYHDLMIEMQGGYHHENACLYIMGEDDIRERLSYLPESFVSEAIAATDLIADSVDVTIPSVGRHYPKFNDDPRDSNQALIQMVIKGLQRLNLTSQEYIDRATMELDVICGANLADYFLLVEDVVRWAKNHDILVGPGRGSVGGSLVAYALGITGIDPIKYGLFFERFYNAGRESGLPDIDIDFPWSKRPLVKEYLAKKYGEDRVRSIGNHITLRPKLAIERSAMALKIPFTDKAKINAIIDQTTEQGALADWDKIWDMVGDQLAPWEQKYPKLFEVAEKLTDRLSSYGTHASAVVVSDVDLPGLLPSRRALIQGEEVFVTQHEMHSVEAQGFLKLDVLGIKTLNILDKTAELAGEKGFRYERIDWDELPEDFWQQLERGLTTGLFQIDEGTGAKRIAKQVHARAIDDLGAIVALNRPGPLLSGDTNRFIDRRAGVAPISLTDQSLGDVLEKTYGTIIYQEQVIQYCWKIGYSLIEADNIRSMMGKKKVEAMKAEESNFIARCEEFGVSPGKAVAIWESIANFSKYGFNKSHAIGYGLTLAWTMYAKWRWPHEFIMACIAVRPERQGDFISEARRMGFDVLPPDINKSQLNAAKHEDGNIYLGLGQVKYVKSRAKWILAHRPEEGYQSLEHLMLIRRAEQERWEATESWRRGPSPNSQCNQRAIDMLVDVGAFDEVEPRDISERERADFEKELLGTSVTDIYAAVIERNQETIKKLKTLDQIENAMTVRVPGIIRKVSKTKTKKDSWYSKKGSVMAHLDIEWEDQTARVTAFPQVWKDNQHWLREGQIAAFTVTGNEQGAVLEKGKVLH